jgi:hypothetical protein
MVACPPAVEKVTGALVGTVVVVAVTVAPADWSGFVVGAPEVVPDSVDGEEPGTVVVVLDEKGIEAVV